MPKKIVNIKKISHDDWLEYRKRGVGGSDCGSLVNMNQYSGPLTLYSRKLGLVKEVQDNEAMRLGRDLEQYVAERFMEATGKKVVNDNFMYQSDDYEFMIADIDRRVVGENAGLECKTMSNFLGYDIEAGEIPEHYYAQLQHYISVMDFSYMYIGILILQKGFYWHKVERNDDFISKLIVAEKDFWENHIIPEIPPEPDGGEPDLYTLKELYPKPNGMELNILGLDRLIQDYKAFGELEKEYKEKKAAVQSQICAKLGNAEIGIGDKYGCSWKLQTRYDLDRDRLKAERPEIYEKYLSKNSFRTFRTKQIKKEK